MLSLPKNTSETMATLLCLAIVVAFIKTYLFT